jgi:hypothetical protein
MEKYLNAVILDENVKMTTQYYLEQCKNECDMNNYHYAYGQKYLASCYSLCNNKFNEFLAVRDKVKKELELGIGKCLENSHPNDYNDEKLKNCIFYHQVLGMNQLNRVIENMISDFELDQYYKVL